MTRLKKIIGSQKEVVAEQLWNNDTYKQFIRETQDTLDDDDNLKQLARDILDCQEGLREYIIEELNDSNPIGRLVNDLC